MARRRVRFTDALLKHQSALQLLDGLARIERDGNRSRLVGICLPVRGRQAQRILRFGQVEVIERQ